MTSSKEILPSAEDMRHITQERQMERAREELRRQQAAEEKKKRELEMFLAEKMTPAITDDVMRRIRNAAENSQTEILVGQFPSAWCTDGGRRINVGEPDWPDTLPPGIAKQFYEFWLAELKAKGFHLTVKIMNFPNGMPGDVGAFLSWGD